MHRLYPLDVSWLGATYDALQLHPVLRKRGDYLPYISTKVSLHNNSWFLQGKACRLAYIDNFGALQVPIPYPSAILIRDNALVVKLESVGLIITRHKVICKAAATGAKFWSVKPLVKLLSIAAEAAS